MQEDKKTKGIVCPYCGESANGIVIDTRLTLDGRRRRRECQKCHKRYTTYEKCYTVKK